ncbi:Gfo/Idh/MocA family protein [Pelagibacterium lentulum]|uniref:Oxidoreductase n=1 Tax=Pelagibacterium lentulum TaxID=2029865 RepID=A0A916VXN3_9HYPH|nr:Gfo/Idh/MocA family oxidoreductase [Pelagibacterium lentulum]GGA49704.1 oxidoreductase [Pelagibacterium lentulum]
MLSIGVIGAGLIGRKHIARIKAHPDFNLTGIADMAVEAVSRDFPGVAVFTDYKELLAQQDLDCVIIASPNQLHADMGIACAEAGIHTIIEKPVTDSLASANALIEAVSKSGIKTLVGHHRRHHHQADVLKAEMARPEFGSLVGVSGVWATHKPRSYFDAAPWRSQPGGGVILINLIHEIDFLRFTAGEIASVSAVASSTRRGFAVEDTAALLIEFESGALGTFLLSDSAVSPWTTEQGVGESVEFPFSGQSSYRFLGSHGALEYPEVVRWTQANGVQNWNEPVLSRSIFTQRIDPYVAQLNHFRDAIEGKVQSRQPVEDGVRTLAATLAVSEAARTGEKIEISEFYPTN